MGVVFHTPRFYFIPEMFSGYFSESVIKSAQKRKLLDIRGRDLRKWATDKHHKVDNKLYGGGSEIIYWREPREQTDKNIFQDRASQCCNRVRQAHRRQRPLWP